MRVEKRIDRDQKKAGEVADAEERAFSNDVIRMLQNAWNNEIPFEDGTTEAERLAAVLAFLATLLREDINNGAPLRPDADARTRLAHEALRMLHDVAQGERNSLHKLFSGIRRAGRPTSTLDLHKGAIIASCVKRVQEVQPDKYPNRADVIRKILKHPGLAQHLGNANQVAKMVGRIESDDKSAFYLSNYYQALKEDGGETGSSVVDRAAFLVGLRHNPLDMRVAMKAQPINLLIYNNGAEEGRPLPEALSRWAAGDVRVKMLEVERGQFVLRVSEQRSVGQAETFGAVLTAITAPRYSADEQEP